MRPELVTDPNRIAQSRADHILRCQDRIAAYQEKLKRGAEGGEKVLIEESIAKWEREIAEARNPKAVAAPPQDSALLSMVNALKAQVAEMQAKMAGKKE